MEGTWSATGISLKYLYDGCAPLLKTDRVAQLTALSIDVSSATPLATFAAKHPVKN